MRGEWNSGVEMCSGATVSILRPSIDLRTAPGIAGQDSADAEAMIRQNRGVRALSRSGGTWRLATRAGDSGKVDERGARRLPLLALPLLPLPLALLPLKLRPSYSTHPSLSYSALIASALSLLLLHSA
jgi:hypothetical protein